MAHTHYTVFLLICAGVLLVKLSNAGFCRTPYECTSTCYRTVSYKSWCGLGFRECYKTRREPFLCKDTCYKLECCEGYVGLLCMTPLCFGSRTCPNDGRCVRPNVCQCAPGYIGPQCSDCGQPNVSISNGYYTVLNGSEFGRQAILQCNQGYRLEGGNNFIQCLDTGFWSISTATCQQACPYGMVQYEQSCYYFGTADLVYTEARNFCHSIRSTLVEVNSVYENIFLKNKMTELETNSTEISEGYWNDLFEATVNGKEVWRETNTTLDPTVSDWHEGQPDDLGGIQSCTMFFRTFHYEWVDVECNDPDKPDGRSDRKARPLCELRLDTLSD